jgi:hypothetical protein
MAGRVMAISNPGQQMLFEKFRKDFFQEHQPNHPVVVKMMAQPTLCCFVFHIVVESPCSWLAGTFTKSSVRD